ncbi:MAG: hypothetical protein OXC79_13110 [Candidatus Poribacteria bacterium]|nr:hypothetical protein [Candidatus Poribacteria bacterium]
MTIDQLSEKRKKLRQQLIDNEAMDGFKELLTVLYSDKVHFIYELLQNAEDARATEVQFMLNEDRLEFEHNGDRLFNIKDVKSITNIGSSTKTKADDVRSIGKFGIGFKAVFAYTSTPEIESGNFHFRIHDMFVPDTDGLAPGALGEKRTRFVFPFDNPDKSPEKASEEIETKLRQLNENALLFLSDIRKIEYSLPNLTTGFLERREDANDSNRIEISVMRPEGIVPEPTHYLRFEKVVSVKDEDSDELKKCRIAIAFGMNKPGGGEWKIVPLNPGQVSIYFPSVKETSNLRFHLHAPFASTVARDSVRDCSANDELRDHLAELIAESMHTIRDQGLLNVEFLATLPNSRNDLLPFYLPIQERLIEEFNTEKLTPMKRSRSEHAAASGCYRTPPRYRALSDLVNDKDLATLLGKDKFPPLWIANPPRLDSSPEDNFLKMLDISEWKIEDLIEALDDSEGVIKWLKKKSIAWHQKLYAFLGDSDYLRSDLRIVRCTDGEYRVGEECYFPIDDVEYQPQAEGTQEGNFHYIVKGAYSSGRSKKQQENAKEFLEKIGVCEVDEAERIKAILNQRYTEEAVKHLKDKQHEKDIQRFIALVEEEPDYEDLFKDYYIFKTAKGYLKPSDVFLDAPYLKTGLSACCQGKNPDYSVEIRDVVERPPFLYFPDDFYNQTSYIKSKTPRTYSSLGYAGTNINPEDIGKLAETVGAKTTLIVKHDVHMRIWKSHPEWDYLRRGTGNWSDQTGIDENYYIFEFQVLLDKPSITKSKLVWQTMYSIPERYLKARFRWNQRNKLHEVCSSLVCELKDTEWVPQKKGKSKTYFVRPCDALIRHLPKGFSYETDQKWLEAIEFGKKAEEKSEKSRIKRAEQRERNQRAQEFGFGSADEAKNAAEFFEKKGISAEESLKKLHVQERRKELLIIELSDAEEKNYEIRARSVKTTGNTIDPRTVLRARYTADENRMHCQMCSKGMPFKKRSSDEDYFEAVEALGKGHFFKEHEAQHLALCPECAAKYKELVKKDSKVREDFHNKLKTSDAPQIYLESNGEAIRIWFQEKHWQDLKTVLYYYENVYDSDEAD